MVWAFSLKKMYLPYINSTSNLFVVSLNTCHLLDKQGTVVSCILNCFGSLPLTVLWVLLPVHETLSSSTLFNWIAWATVNVFSILKSKKRSIHSPWAYCWSSCDRTHLGSSPGPFCAAPWAGSVYCGNHWNTRKPNSCRILPDSTLTMILKIFRNMGSILV